MAASTQDELAALERIGTRIALTKDDGMEAVRSLLFTETIDCRSWQCSRPGVSLC